MEYSFDRPIDPAQLQRLLQTTSWGAERSLDEIRRFLDATPVMVGAWDGDRLVGYARAVTDGIFRALIDDVVVASEHRRTGIGMELLRRLLERLTGIEEVFLRCAPDVAPFYERLGFVVVSDDITMDYAPAGGEREQRPETC